MPPSGRLARQFDEFLAPVFQEFSGERVIERIRRKDHRLWKAEPTEITNRLGWLDLPTTMQEQLSAIRDCVGAVRDAGIRDVVLLGMGGSSLGPEVLRASFDSARGFPRLWVLDSTVPQWIRSVSGAIQPAKTLFLVSSKSGGTIEVLSLFAHFWDLVGKTKGSRGGQQFIAITDPGTSLERMAKEHDFLKVFCNPPDIGGRYSVLSFFGLVPAALMGLDVKRLLDRAAAMADRCGVDDPASNPGAYLGAAMGKFATSGRDKVTIFASPAISTFGLWAEQLLAESTGKEGTGLVPVAQEPICSPHAYGDDRFFVYLRLRGDANQRLDRQVLALARSHHPVIQYDLQDRYDLGAEFFRWEYATAVAGHVLKIHPFDQPNVQESKDNTARVLASLNSSGQLPEQKAATPRQAAAALSIHLKAGSSYLAILAYTAPSRSFERAVARFRASAISRYHIATTSGYGPRYLHSTGQLHKGGPPSGVFLELVDRMKPDLPIPGKPFTFGTLAKAQAAGDLESLSAHNRAAFRINLGRDPSATVEALGRAFGLPTPSRKRTKSSTRRKHAGRR
ncbi:MAG TPA: glucose-6-phosphate isomerase [Nitrospira sp.]|nr:glucose-6-phosphate isomerase [Nitrospira sp.]